MNELRFEITSIKGHFERLTTYVIVYSHRVNITSIYPTENGYEVYPYGYEKDILKFKFAHLMEAISFSRGIAFANGSAAYLFANDWKRAELKKYKRSYQRHKSKSH